MPERTNERAARAMVASILGVDVRRFEDGKSPGQVDAVFTWPDGRRAALEVVADHEDAFNAQWSALQKIGHKLMVPDLVGVWPATLDRRARIREVARCLPGIAVQWQKGDESSVRDQSRERSYRRVPNSMRDLGVRSFQLVEGSDATGIIRLWVEGWGGTAGSGELAPYVERILSEQDDVPVKLSRHAADERHAFIWTTIGTDYGVQFALENRGQALPSKDPVLPKSVTHVWVAGSFTSQGVLAWFPDRGWWRPDWVWPSNGPLVLDDTL